MENKFSDPEFLKNYLEKRESRIDAREEEIRSQMDEAQKQRRGLPLAMQPFDAAHWMKLLREQVYQPRLSIQALRKSRGI